MKIYLKKAWRFFLDSQSFLYQGFKKNLLKQYLKAYLHHLIIHLKKFHHYILDTNIDHKEKFNLIRKRVQGLHALLPNADDFTYSILIELDHLSPKIFKSCLTSASLQTAPHFEILLGTKTTLAPPLLQMIQGIQAQYPGRIKFFDFASISNSTFIYNLLAQKSTGKFLLIVNQEDWLRPDLLFRYEQFLRTRHAPEHSVISCLKNEIDANDNFIPSLPTKEKPLAFPYIFQSGLDLRGWLIPKALWDKAKGLRETFPGVEVEDLLFRLDLAGAAFTTLPLCLYYCRRQQENRQNNPTPSVFLDSLKEYAVHKGFNWTFAEGYHSNSARAIPQVTKKHKIQILIPYKDQKELTFRCVDSVMKQKGIDFQITAIDNGSHDLAIGEAIQHLGGEVLRVDEPFNYSRLNNHAVKHSKMAHECDLILFLNNDVELDENALLEMVCWIDQPQIGMVGARLHYPNGQLQHGGVVLKEYYLPEYMWWEHIEKYSSFDDMKESKVQGIVDAVTAACALIKKENFLKVGGFDEIWHPIGYSDTNLAIKLKHIGLKCFYTPYAHGIHHESISRKNTFEDIENTRWLHELILGRGS